MAIKNKDGTIFKLVGPNPIMKNQDFWEESVLHNFEYKEITTSEVLQKEEEQDPDVMKIVISEEQPELPEYKKIEEVVPEEIEVTIKEVPVPEKKKKKEEIKIPKWQAHCLPAVVETVEDQLYGDSKRKISYGNRFSMELIISEENDLLLKAWTNIHIGEESIVFIVKEKRWWKVDKCEINHGGFMIYCSVSAITPSFSD